MLSYISSLINVLHVCAGTKSPIIPFAGGDDASDKIVRQLVNDAGFRPASAGHNLRDAHLLESLGVLLHRLIENEYEHNSNLAWSVISPSNPVKTLEPQSGADV